MGNPFYFRLAEKEEEHDAAVEQLHHRDETIAAMMGEKVKLDRDGSSRVANLNQVLMQEKQTSAQLSEENERLKRNERELLAKYETLQQKYEQAVTREHHSERDRQQKQQMPTPMRTPLRPMTTPGRPIPQETELDALQIENAKLKQDLECLHTNFQLTSQKSAQMKKDAKEMEKSLADLQAVCDQLLTEKEDMELRHKEAMVALQNSTGSQLNDQERNAKLAKEVEDLQTRLETLQHQNLDLQCKLKAEIAQSQDSKDVIGKLDAQIKALRKEKKNLEDNLSSALARLQNAEEELVSSQQSSAMQSEIQRQSSEAIIAHKRKFTLLKDENQELREQLEKASHSIDAHQSQIHSLKESVKLLESKLASTEAQKELLNTERKLQSHLPTEIQDLQNKLASLSEEHEALAAANKGLKEAHTQSESHVQELTKANAKLQREANHNWELSKKLQKELEKQESRSLESKEGLKEKEQQCSKMAREIEDLKLELSRVTNAKTMYEVEVGKLVSKLEDLEQCNFELSTKLSSTQNETTSAKHSQSEMQSRVEELERMLRDAEGSLLEKDSQIAELHCTSELLEGESGALLSQVTSLSEMVASRNSKIEALQSQVAQYESDSREIMMKMCELEADHDRYVETQQASQQEIDSLKKALESAQNYEMEAKNTILSLKLEVKQLQEYNSSLETVNSDLQDKIKAEMAKNEQLHSTWENTEKNLHNLEQELKLKSASLRAAQDDVDFVKKSSEDAAASLTTEVDALQIKCRELQDTCDNLQQAKTEMTAQLTSHRTDLRELQHLNSLIKGEKESLTERYSQLEKEVGCLKEELHAAQSELKDAKTSLWYQKEKLSEAQRENTSLREEMAHTVHEYEKLKESALSLLDQSSLSDENVSTPTKVKLRGILKKPCSKGVGVLRSVENLVD